ncbi:MAG: gliding motility-associated ABC transporter ATP-binding subunit GldA [Bacteroidota bacterium]
MSISVKGITKRYGSQVAVNNVSFEISSGEIVGFIGPNGAGKSTTMKIITGTLPPDEGSVLIKDLPALEHQKEIRHMIGYLPEHNPLYLDMYIREYLNYVAGFYKSKVESRKSKVESRKSRVEDVIERTGLGPEAGKTIGKLSKGYRQRVGLAQALIHDPDILILDEPTSGLDPNQLAEIRTLISNIGNEKTVLLSTHILQEVEAICDRVIIINQGCIVADELADKIGMSSSAQVQTIHVEIEESADTAIWETLSFIKNIKTIGDKQFLLETHETRDVRGDIFNFAVSQGLTILSLSLQKKSLEEVFREITSR